MWRNFGCEGFEFHGEKLAESAGDSELAHSPSMATREGEEEERERVNGSEAGGELGKAPGRLGDARRPGNRDRSPRRHAQRLPEASAFITGTVPHREKHGGGRMAYDRWGPRVRNFLI